MSLTEPPAFLKEKASGEVADTMRSLSVSTHRGLVHWKGLLLVVSLLSFWSLPTTAQENMWLKNAAEGKDVRFRIRNIPPDVERLAWYRGKVLDRDHMIAFLAQMPNLNVRFPKGGRMILSNDGSLLLKKVVLKDSGIYTIVAIQKNSIILIGYGELRVYRRVRKPTLQASNTTVTENKDSVVFTCNSNARRIQWFFKPLDSGKKLQPTRRIKLSRDHQRLTIDLVKREDAGYYQCKASNPISSAASVAVKLNVKFE